MNGLYEILSNKEWMLQEDFLNGILPTLFYNIANHTAMGIDKEKKAPMLYNRAGDDIFREYQVTADGKATPRTDGWGEDLLSRMTEPFVNVVPVDGVITRDGGACSYGSKNIRDWIMKAADNKFCVAHVIVINTPGGSVWAKNDFSQAIDYAHAKGQRVIAFIDGMCASLGMYLASFCDEVYVMHPKAQLGSVGVFAAFFTRKNGEKNQFTGETFRTYYATKSVNKNKSERDIAEEDDPTELIKELDMLEEEFASDMRKAFPKATDEHLNGKMFYAEEVMGILCDGQMMLGDVIQHAFDLASGATKPIERTANRPIGKLAAKQQILFTNNNPEKNMEKNYQNLAKMMGVDELVVTNEGTHLDVALLDTLQTNIEGLQADAAKVADLTQQLADSKKQADETIANFQAQIASLNETIAANEEAATASAETIANLNETINGLNVELNEAKASLSTAQQTIAERDQNIADLQAQVEELQTSPGSEPGAGASPANNGDGAAAPHQASNAPQWDPAKTPMENKKAMEEYEKSLKQGLH